MSVAACYQHSLFDAGEEVGLDSLSGSLERSDLGNGAWVDLRTGWVRGAGQLFEHLLAAVDWRAERRPMYDRVVDVPRLLSWYGEGADLPHPVLTEAKAALDRRYRSESCGPLATAGLCLYRDGRDSVAWHGDTIARTSPRDSLVAIICLGAVRPLLLRPVGGGSTVRYFAGHGDLLVMGGSCQRTWQHAIAKTSRAVGPQISVQFRSRGVS